MTRKRLSIGLLMVVVVGMVVPACSNNAPGQVCVVLDTGGENDKGFNEFTLKGAREAAREAELEFAHIVTTSDEDYGPYIKSFVEEGCGLIFTVGFLMAQATAEAARANPDIHFAIIDFEYVPGDGCSEEVDSCYTAEGGLANVTSLTFAEDQAGYLAGTLAGCMTQTNVIGSVSGMEIPPVVRFVTGYQNGARAENPTVTTLNEYLPDFNDAYTGKRVGERQIAKGADVIFGVGGNTGNGGLLAAHDIGLMTIGVDVDQYYTFPEITSSLLTSASKNVDVAAARAVRDYAFGSLASGPLEETVSSGGVGLAPYHDWESRIPDECKAAVQEATDGLKNGTVSTGM